MCGPLWPQLLFALCQRSRTGERARDRVATTATVPVCASCEELARVLIKVPQSYGLSLPRGCHCPLGSVWPESLEDTRAAVSQWGLLQSLYVLRRGSESMGHV